MSAIETNRIRMTDPQGWAMHSLLCTVFGQYQGLELHMRNEILLVTIWRQGDPTTWAIAPDGETREAKLNA
jgi:hypothetical protein